MKALFAPEHTETPALHAWREQSLTVMLRLGLMSLLLLIITDTVGSLQDGQFVHIAFTITSYALFALLAFVRAIPFRLRVVAIVGLGIAFYTYTLIHSGLMSAGRIGIFANIILAALLLGRRPTIVVWILGILSIGVGLVLFASQPASTIAEAATRLTDPNMLVTQWLFTAGFSGIFAGMVLWLLKELNTSLRVTEQALAERDRINATLEQSVAERTAQLEQALASLNASEVKYKTLFQTLPTGITIIDNHGQLLEYNTAAQQIGGATRIVNSQASITPTQLIRPDGSPLPLGEYPGRRVLQEQRPITDIEIGIAEPDTDPTWISITAAPLNLAGYGAVIVYNDITARKNAEQALKRQVQVQAAIARSSQMLLDPAPTAADQQCLLKAAIEALYTAIDVNPIPIYLLQNVDDPREGLSARISISVGYPHPNPAHPLVDQIPWSAFPAGIRRILEAGDLWAGPIQSLLSTNPWLLQIFQDYAINSMLCFPIVVDQVWWGSILFADPQPEHVWNIQETLLLRTTAENIGTALHRWQTETTLAEREHFIQRVMQATPDLIYVADLVTRRNVYINRPLASLAGYSDQQLETNDAITARLLNAEDQARLAEHLKGMAEVADNQIREIEYGVQLANGQSRWVLSRDQVFLRDETGRPRQILSIAQNITERKTAEQALTASEAQLRALRDALPDLMFIVRTDGTILDYHAPPNAMLLLPPEAFLGQRLDKLLPDPLAGTSRAAIANVVTRGGIETFEYSMPLNGIDFIYEARVVHIAGDTCLVVAHDITARHQAAAALLRAKETAENADRAKSTFLAHVSHEIRTPLTAIIGVASLLLESKLSPSQRENASIIRTAGETLLSLIGDILDFSKIEAGQIEIADQPFDLRVTCRTAVDLLSHTAAHKGLQLNWQIAAEVPATVIGDSGRLRQVVVNLLSNAVKFTDKGEVRLIVHSRPLNDDTCAVQIIVHDTGVGIAPNQLAQIFKPFVQLDQMLPRQMSGTGLGLAISQQLVELMGGRLEVESALGVGTTFTLTLPLKVAAVEATQPKVEAVPVPIAALRVLIAEDNPINQEVLRRMLEQLGITPTVVGDGEAALASVSAVPYDLVLMDIQMPILDGETAAKRIRLLGKTIAQPQIVALTASALRGDRERYLEAGMDDYLSKPVQLEDLRRLLAPLGANLPASTQEALTPKLPPNVKNEEEGAALVDWPAIKRLLASLEMPRDQATALVHNLYERELPTQLAALTAAVIAEDRPQTARLAHKLRGGSRQLGALALTAACLDLETAAKDPDMPALISYIEHVRQIYNETWVLVQEQLSNLA